MKLSCNTIEDILPLVVEGLASQDTVNLVEEHINNCPECKKEYEDLKGSKTSFEVKEELETIPLKNVKRKLKKRNIYTGLMTGLIVSLILLILVNIATKPIPLSYIEAIESTKLEDGKLFIEFKEKVSDYSIESYGLNHSIMAWNTIGSKFIDSGERKNTVINIDREKSTVVNYVSQISDLDKLIYGTVDYDGQLTLPRLAMNYYLSLMFIIFIITGILFFIFKNTDKIKKVIKIIMLFSLSYILGHMAIFAGRGSTHHMIRDLYFVFLGTLLIFSIFILTLYKDSFMKIKDDGNIKI